MKYRAEKKLVYRMTAQANLKNGMQHKQQGVVLFIALIVLVAMTIAGIALVRSVDTSNLIAGNLAFKQGATLSAEGGAEKAIEWLTSRNGSLELYTPERAAGYYATSQSTLDTTNSHSAEIGRAHV